MYENSRTTDIMLAGCYALTAMILVALYRAPLVALWRDIIRWRESHSPNIRSVRTLPGILWRDVNEAVDNAGG